MSSSPQLIQVGAVFDGAQLKAAMDASAASTQQALAKIQGAFDELQAATAARISQLEAKLAELEASHVKHMGGAHQAVGGLKLAFEDAGVGINRHVGRWLASLPLLGAAFSAAFPVFAIISFADSLFKASEKMDTHSEKMAKLARESLDLSLSFDKQAESIQIVNLKLEDHIATLQRKPATNGVAIAALEGKRALEELIKSFQDAIAKEKELLAGEKQGFLNRLLHGDSGINDVISQIDEFQEKISEAATKFRLASKEGNKQQTADAKAELDQQNADYHAFLTAQLAANDQARQAKIEHIKTETELINKVNNLTLTSAQFEDQISRNVKAVNQEYEKRDQTIRSLLILMKGEAEAEAGISKHSDLLGVEAAAVNLRKMQDLLDKAGQEIRRMAESSEKAQEEASARFNKESIDDSHREVEAKLKALNEQRQAYDEYYTGQIADAKKDSEIQIDLIEQRFVKGQINQQQEIKLISQAKETELAIERNFQQQRFALWDGDLKKQRQIQNAIDVSYRAGSQIATKAVTDGLKAQEQQYKQVFSQIGSSIATNVMDVLKGTETVAAGFQKMYQSLIASLLDYFAKKAEKMAEDWLLEELGLTKKKISNAAAASSSAGAAAAETLADVPYPLNIPASAEVLGIGEGYAIDAMSSAGGDWQVDRDRLNFVHKNETILPADIAGKLRGMVEGGGVGAEMHVHFNISAIDGHGVKDHLDKFGNHYVDKFFKIAKRKGFKG